MQVPACQGKENAFLEGEKEVGRATMNQESMALSVIKFLPGKNIFSSSWALLLSEGVRAPPSGLPTLFN